MFIFLVCLTTFHWQMSVCFLPRYPINFMVVILWWMVMKWKWSFVRRELLSSFQLTEILPTYQLWTTLLSPKISRRIMPLSSGLLSMQLGLMQPSTTLPTCHLTKICQCCLGLRVSSPASHVLAVWRIRTCWCLRKNYSSGIGNSVLWCSLYNQWCAIVPPKIHLAGRSVIHPL